MPKVYPSKIYLNALATAETLQEISGWAQGIEHHA